MWSMTFRDLRYRKRRFVIAIGGTALVFAMALVMAGMSAGFRQEVDRVLGAFGADAWVVPEGVVGPFTSVSVFPESSIRPVAATPAVDQAEGVVVLRQTVLDDGTPRDVNVLGVSWDTLPGAEISAGRPPEARGEAIADGSLGATLGDELTLTGHRVTIVGLTEGLTLYGGVPVVIVPVRDAQEIGFGGQRLISSIAVRGSSPAMPGHAVLGNDDARADLLRPLGKGVQAIDSVQILLWIVAAIIIAAVIYLSALERLRDFAVLKAVGASTSRLFGSLALQSVIVSLVAALIAFGISLALAPTFALPIEIPVKAFMLLPVVALIVGIGASLSGLKRAIDVDPARAFGGA